MIIGLYVLFTVIKPIITKVTGNNIEISDFNYKKYFDEDMYIMEIKTLGAMPWWLVDSLSELKIYPSSFSKIGKIYCKKMEVENVK